MKCSSTLALALAAGSLLVASEAASAAIGRTAPTPVTVVMRDPGCHWFAANGTFLRTMDVNGPALVTNHDMAALDIVGGHSGMVTDKVGKQITLEPGNYRIVMVGQARDDNVLKLLVR